MSLGESCDAKSTYIYRKFSCRGIWEERTSTSSRTSFTPKYNHRSLDSEQPTNQEFTGIIQKDAGKLSMVKVAQTQYGKNRSENFAVMDMQAFRYVPNKEKLRGFASANDITSAAILDSNFTRLLLQEL